MKSNSNNDEEDLSGDINADDIEENVSNDEENDDDDRNKKRSHDEPETNTTKIRETKSCFSLIPIYIIMARTTSNDKAGTTSMPGTPKIFTKGIDKNGYKTLG